MQKQLVHVLVLNFKRGGLVGESKSLGAYPWELLNIAYYTLPRPYILKFPQPSKIETLVGYQSYKI
jgi:hypothetical protein